MRKLLNTLYITSSGAYLSLDGENAVVLKSEQEVARFPLHNIENVVAFNYTGASPAFMGACAKRGIALLFMTTSGRFLARVTGKEYGNVILRKAQYRMSDNQDISRNTAAHFLTGKIYNTKWVIERATRDYPQRLDIDKLKCVSAALTRSMTALSICDNLEELRGIEGEAASQYFGVFDDLILQQKEDFYFINRSRRPTLDPVNSLLSFIYTLLAHDCASALETVGLDPYVGFLHRDRPGRISLALDLMEEIRCVYADRFVLTLINKRIICKEGFTIKENGAVIMDDNTKRAVLHAYQERKQEKIVHPFLSEKIEWGLVPYVQAMLLARFIRGDLDAYPPFLWK